MPPQRSRLRGASGSPSGYVRKKKVVVVVVAAAVVVVVGVVVVGGLSWRSGRSLGS